jgi:hypothetical protein
MGVEIVEHQHDALGLGVGDVDQLPDLLRPVQLGALLGDRDAAPAAQGLADEEEIEHPAPFVLVVLAAHLAGLHGQRGMHLAEDLFARLVQTDDRAARVVRAGVDL